MKSEKAITVQLVLIPECTASILLSIYDVFSMLPVFVPGEAPYSVSIVGHSTDSTLTASGIPLTADASFADSGPADIVIVPSLLLTEEHWPVGRYPELTAWLKKQYRQGAILCSACSGIFPLMETGYFDHSPITCHWAYSRLFRNTYPDANLRIEKTLIIDGPDNRLIMSGASASWHDLVLYLISRCSGPAAATAIAKFFLLSWHPEGQTPYIRFEENSQHGDAVVTKAQAWVAENWRTPKPIESLVKHSGLPERSFNRRFKNATGVSPKDYVQHVRVEHAKQMLENSQLPVDEIAPAIGYEDGAFFRKIFKRITSLTPSAYRMKFRTTRLVEAGQLHAAGRKQPLFSSRGGVQEG